MFKELTVEDKDVRVDFEWIGEGHDGDYPCDKNDEPLLRFTVFKLTGPGEWDEVECGSYCTLIPAKTDRAEVVRLAHLVLKTVGDAVRKGRSIKRACAELSWMKPGFK